MGALYPGHSLNYGAEVVQTKFKGGRTLDYSNFSIYAHGKLPVMSTTVYKKDYVSTLNLLQQIYFERHESQGRKSYV